MLSGDFILQTKVRRRREDGENSEQYISSTPQKQNLLDFVLTGNDKGSLSRNELRDMVMTFLLAGHETSSNTLSWTLLLLAQNSECQELCHREVVQVLEAIGG